jgi:FkbM family methyltransferase
MFEKKWFRSAVLFYLRYLPGNFLKYYLMFGVLGHTTPNIRFKNRDDLVFDLDLNDHVQKRIYCYHYFEKEYIRYIKNCLLPGDTAIDVGAHVGQYSLIAAKLVGSKGKVYSFEPNSITAECLRRNIKLNSFYNIKVIQKAVTSKMGKRIYYPSLDKGNIGSGTLVCRQPVSDNSFNLSGNLEVDSISLDEYSANNGIDQCRLLKIDVEGYEMEVLKGAEKLLERNPDIIIMCELSDENLSFMGIVSRDVIDYMSDLGFECYMFSKYINRLVKPAATRRFSIENVIFKKHENQHLSSNPGKISSNNEQRH